MPNVPQNPHLSNTVPDQEYTADSSVLSCSFGVGESSASKTYNVQWDKFNVFVAEVLGFSQKSGMTIERSLPKQHPEFPWMYASRITSLQGIASTGNAKANAGGITAAWKMYRCTVQFETPPYQVTNGKFGFIIPTLKPESTVIQRKSGSFVWWAGTPNVGGLPIVDNYTASQRLSKLRISLKWIQIPDDGLFAGGSAGGNFYSPNIESVIGNVNSKPFLGYPVGTVLFTGWTPTARMMPAPPGGDPSNLFPRAWDVDLEFVYFNPPSFIFGGVGGGGTLPLGATLGHNLVPHPFNGLWYPAFIAGAQGTNQGLRYLPADLNVIFQMN